MKNLRDLFEIDGKCLGVAKHNKRCNRNVNLGKITEQLEHIAKNLERSAEADFSFDAAVSPLQRLSKICLCHDHRINIKLFSGINSDPAEVSQSERLYKRWRGLLWSKHLELSGLRDEGSVPRGSGHAAKGSVVDDRDEHEPRPKLLRRAATWTNVQSHASTFLKRAILSSGRHRRGYMKKESKRQDDQFSTLAQQTAKSADRGRPTTIDASSSDGSVRSRSPSETDTRHSASLRAVDDPPRRENHVRSGEEDDASSTNDRSSVSADSSLGSPLFTPDGKGKDIDGTPASEVGPHPEIHRSYKERYRHFEKTGSPSRQPRMLTGGVSYDPKSWVQEQQCLDAETRARLAWKEICPSDRASEMTVTLYDDQPSNQTPNVSNSYQLTNYYRKGARSVIKSLFQTLERTICDRDRASGYVYAYRRKGDSGHLKIGYSKDTEPRLNKWKTQCGFTLTKVFDARMQCAAGVIERLIQLTLYICRRKDETCSAKAEKEGRAKAESGEIAKRHCTSTHGEWFEVTAEDARRTVAVWQSFSRTEPFVDGQLIKYWREGVNVVRKHFEDNGEKDGPEIWFSWMKEALPRFESASAIVPITEIKLLVRIKNQGDDSTVEILEQIGKGEKVLTAVPIRLKAG
jgi:hypothetical protein